MRITHNFTDFPSDKFYVILTQQRRPVLPCKLSEQNFGPLCKKLKMQLKSVAKCSA